MIMFAPLCRGCLPAEGAVGICSKLPAYLAAHNTAPAQVVTTDLTSPLVRSLIKQREDAKEQKAGAKQHGGSGTKRKRKSTTPTSKQWALPSCGQEKCVAAGF